ncbi:caspase family protein [Streptomyces sp. McG3]|uniref:HD domain-containing protein n=1 Tax=Streptomyces sp. McG3 TaxID=2725483 RepID=UPI001BEA5F7B|nr:caspase family protein [Streptomyces sp. McG3]MBT2900878.1 peptidase C14 [Streptomyces sp. McG3]
MRDFKRTALLIGVGDNPGAKERLQPLGATVEADLRVMSGALRGSGYTVESLRDPTRNEIAERITALSSAATAGSTLLIYFTGHGVRIGNIDYLVPADALAPAGNEAGAGGNGSGWEQPHVRESLLDADISKYLGNCRADTVLWLIDACRADEGEESSAFGSHITQGPPHVGFAMMTGCAPGERSGFAEAGSFFSLALARAFDPLTEAATVDQVYRAVKRETQSLARRARAGQQQVGIRYGSDLEAETRSREVAHGRRLLEAWQDVVRTPELWDHVVHGDRDSIGSLQDCLGRLAAEVARHVHHAQERLPDPWADDDYPVRLVRDRLPSLLPKDAELSALEVTALIAGVLLHEAAWADRLSQAAELSPRLMDRMTDADDQRRHYEQITEYHPQIAEKLADRYWWETDPSDDHDAVMLWLVHRWIGERFATDEKAVPDGWVSGFVYQLLEAAPPSAGEVPTGRAAQLATALRTVAAGLVLGAPPEEQRLTLPERHVVRRTPQRLRIRPLAALLRLAGLLAFDARRLPEVVAEHLAVSDPVVPREVITVLRDAVWDPDRGDNASPYLHLDAVCTHPAVHSALASVVEDADELGHLLRETAGRLPIDEAALLGGLPARLTDHRLRPDEQGGLDAYDVPLSRFSLAQTEIRRLLMGKQLYDGKSDLALRELYQNALDACRYRDMRIRYLRACGKEPRPWEGRIRIETGKDDRGHYVECVDNGVGMTVDQLRNTFTRAGRRFDQSHAFRREQAAWLRQDRALRLYPNSRFGIGVFSYFMLADEMTVLTRPVGPDGRPAERALRVEIPVSGSLFRVREADERDGVVLPDGGTRVRLYLRDSSGMSGSSCGSALRSLVLISEFGLEVRGEHGWADVWEPGRLQSGGVLAIKAGSAVEAVPGVLWWVEGDGAIVCDGIATDKRTFGYVLNLSGEQAGRLSVNRNKLEHYDVRWAREQIRRGAAALADWTELSLGWLWAMESRHSTTARILWEEWQGRNVRASDEYGRWVDLDEVGWFKLDAHLGGTKRDYGEDRRLRAAVRPWRSAALGPSQRRQREAGPLSLEGHPVPQPGWSDIAAEVKGDWRNAVVIAGRQHVPLSDVLRATRGMRIAHPRFAGPTARPGALGWTPDATDLHIMDGLLGPDREPWDSPVLTADGRALSMRESTSDIFYRHRPGDLSGIVRTSAKHGRSLGELADACAKFAPLVAGLPFAVPDRHRDHVCTEDELALLYLKNDKTTWRPVASPWDIRTVAERLGVSPREVQRRTAAFGWLRPVPDPAAVDRWAAVPDELFPLLRRYVVDEGGKGPWLPWAATIDLAAVWEIPLRRAERILAEEAQALGLFHRRRYKKGSPGRRETPSPDAGELVGWLHDVDVRLEDGVSLRDLAYARHYEMSWETLSWLVDDLRAVGVDLADAAHLLRAWDGLPTPSRYAFSGTDPSFEGADYPVPATSAVLFTASQQLGLNLSYLWKTARRTARQLDLGDELVAPELPGPLKKFSPTWHETAALIDTNSDEDDDSEWFESPRWTTLTPHELVTYAQARHIGVRSAFETLAPLRAIGALVPELAAEAVAALPDDAPPGTHDAATVDPGHRVSPAGSPLLPLDLVSIAGHLGESVASTWRRITPYLALEQAEPSIPHVPDVVPRWQDLAVLSEGFDGRLPSIGGPVTPERLVACAQAVGETAEWVRERLVAYADMFGLDMTPVAEHENGG